MATLVGADRVLSSDGGRPALEFDLQVPSLESPGEPPVAVAQDGSAADAEAVRWVRTVLAVDLADGASRAQVLRMVDDLRPSPQSISRAQMLDRRIAALAQADSGSSKATTDLRDLALRMRELDPTQPVRRRGLCGRRTESREERLERLCAARGEIDVLLASLTRSAEVLRQNEVALDGFEADIVAESRQLAIDIERADSYGRALVAAVERARTGQADPDVLGFVDREVLGPLERHRMYLQNLLAVNQQAALSVSILRETNFALIQNIRLITVATKHSLDTAQLLSRMQASRERATEGEQAGPTEELEAALAELRKALEAQDAWRGQAATQREEALDGLHDLSVEVFETTDWAGGA